MPEKGYIDLKKSEISMEVERRSIADVVRTATVDLIREFAFFNPEYEDSRLDLPVVKWNEDGSELLHVNLVDTDGEAVTKESLEEAPEIIHYSRVSTAELIFHPKESDALTVLTMHLWAGPDSTPVIHDFDGRVLPTQDLQALKRDLTRYRELVEAGQLESVNPS
jgi:hypothetical protein